MQEVRHGLAISKISSGEFRMRIHPSNLENFWTESGHLTRKGLYSNQWVCDTSGRWHEIVTAKFTADATARKEAR
ncbi:MAG: DUF3472 domain-containing protein [bacterium]